MRHTMSLPQISTNVRFLTTALVAPGLASLWAERLFLTPPRPRYAEGAIFDLIDARAATVVHKGRHIATWTWGSRTARWGGADAPAVLLVHGWGGQGVQMRPFVFPLLQAGFRVITYDHPAHGLSEGRLTGLPDLADVLAEVAGHHGGVRAVIAHSTGAAAVALAHARGLRLARTVLVSPPADFVGYSRRFARWHWFPESIRSAMQAAIEERFGVSWSELDIARLAARVSAEALVIHDRGDRIVPFRQGERVAREWPRARLLATRGLGHGRILADEGVARAAADFVAGRSQVANLALPAAPHPAPML